MTDIEGRIAVVTGGGSGIGRALCEALAENGVEVVVADIIESRANEVAHRIIDRGGRAVGVMCDASDRSSLLAVKEAAESAFGQVSLLFANAGATSLDRLTDVSEWDVQWITGVNYFGVVTCLHVFLPEMVAAGGGHVVATSSEAGLLPGWIPHHALYSGAKAGVIGFMLNIRNELAETGIGCTVLCPGGVTTRIAESSRYRPQRFGGPSDRSMVASSRFEDASNLSFRAPEQVAEMTLGAVRRNTALVVTDASRKQLFLDTFAATVVSAYDDALEFDREREDSRGPRSHR